VNLDLTVSGLLSASAALPGPAPRAAALELFVARGAPCDPGPADLAGWLFAAFGFALPDAPGPAPYTLFADRGTVDERYWLRADPVHLAAGRIGLLLAPIAEGELDPAEADALRATIAEHFAAKGMELVAPHTLRWYLGCSAEPRISTTAPQDAVGPLTEEKLPTGDDSREWRRLLTEAQMLLHEHPVNQSREAAGRPVVNAVWPWGGGRFVPPRRPAAYTDVCSDAPLALGLARAADVTTHAVPHSAESLLAACPTGAQVLVALDLAAPAWGPPSDDRDAVLAAFEAAWCSPLRAALERGVVETLRLRLLDASAPLGRDVTRRSLRRWWRRPRPLPRHG